ncbi:MAG: NADH-quinone oxidoreductase subunit C [Chloroflexi bacterium]|nr:NADH-quinone oxidoreductase subunit C [Chloroflexota bacterium]
MTQERPARAHPAPAEAKAALSEKGVALTALLSQALSEHHPTMGAALDEVVITVGREALLGAAFQLRDDPRLSFAYLMCLSVVDYETNFEVVYHLRSLAAGNRCALKVTLPYDDPRVPSVIGVWPGADWHEREGHDLFGVVFEGHPNLAPLLLYEGFEGYPGRKSYPINDYQEW